jgi:hypothetical protein
MPQLILPQIKGRLPATGNRVVTIGAPTLPPSRVDVPRPVAHPNSGNASPTARATKPEGTVRQLAGTG